MFDNNSKDFSFSSFDNYLIALADLPAEIRNQKLGASPAKKPFSLNNDRSVAFSKNTCKNSDLERSKAVEIFGQHDICPDDDRPDYIRSAVRSFLREHHHVWENFSNSYWPLREKLTQDISIIAGIEDDDFSLKETWFTMCNKYKTWGFKVKDANNKEYITQKKCGNKYCLGCADSKRNKVSGHVFDFIKQNKKDIKYVYDIVFTLPDALAGACCVDREQRKTVDSAIHKTLCKYFTSKTRSNLGVVPSRHFIGDSNIWKNRYHVHCSVLACTMEDGKISNVHQGRVDIEAIKNLFMKFLDKKGIDAEKIINPQVKFYDLCSDKMKWGRLRHNLNYNLRGFGNDIMKTAIFHDLKNDIVITKTKEYRTEEDGSGMVISGVFVCKSIDLSRRWVEIRNMQPALRMWGFLDKYKSLMEVDDIQEPIEVERVVPVLIKRERIKKYDKKHGKVMFRKIDIAIEFEMNDDGSVNGKKEKAIYIIGKDIKYLTNYRIKAI
jgi:hypothetical protein